MILGTSLRQFNLNTNRDGAARQAAQLFIVSIEMVLIMYNPDFWAVVKITGDDPHYRVFGSWTGGYTYGSSWRMNSGITSVSIDNDYFLFTGSSGSVYKCHKSAYGVHYGSRSEFDYYINNSDGKITMMPEETNWSEVDWIIS